MPLNYKVETLLSREELDEFQIFCNKPARTIDEAHDWLLSRGFTLGRTAVGNWLREFRENAMHDRMRQAIQSSDRFIKIAQEAGASGLAAATLTRAQQLLFEVLVKDDEMSIEEIRDATAAIERTVRSARHVEKLKEEERAERKSAIDAAEKSVKAGASVESVISQLRDTLGIKEAA